MIVTVCAICMQNEEQPAAHMDGTFQNIHRVHVERLARLETMVTLFEMPTATGGSSSVSV